MVDALRMLPRLESLEVLHAIPDVTGEHPQIPLEFQHLHSIKLAGDAANCGCLLSLIKCQRTPTLELECYLDDQHSQLPSFTRALVHQLCTENSGKTCLQSISVACEGDDPWRTLRIRGRTTVELLSDIREEHFGAGLNVALTVSEDLDDSESTALRYLFSQLPLSNVRAIWLDSVLFRRSKVLINIFDQMGKLEYMAFTAIRGLDALFRRAGHVQLGDTEKSPLFPKVSTIVLEAIRFSQPMVAQLQDFLKDRRTAGTGIHEITFTECENLHHGSMEEFQAHCIEVHWDRFESVSQDDEESGEWASCENITSDEE
ncbi:hypothetical protein NLI96_g3783 [Meripilus lineatus]|uniref:Uncharacterized protein n=1 Tax=Meripilus lineatus TaxID=2056292 RepID=A0AAD5V8E3_9APHY|nr:hypothetical protein NLI96_g3783 [Physisporinus lineatus]